jgi:sorbitol-specific phosphotransferase system component IIBC
MNNSTTSSNKVRPIDLTDEEESSAKIEENKKVQAEVIKKIEEETEITAAQFKKLQRSMTLMMGKELPRSISDTAADLLDNENLKDKKEQ